MKRYGKHCKTSWISLMMILSLSGCSMMLSTVPSGSVSMEQTYNDAINGSDNLSDGSSASLTQLRTPIQANNNYVMNTEKIALQPQFKQIANPNIVMYVYPHLAGSGNTSVPVPGYYTVFPLYTRVYYALEKATIDD